MYLLMQDVRMLKLHISAFVFNVSCFRLTELSLNVRSESESRSLKEATREKERDS